MILSVPANYDPALVRQLALYPVEEVYGKFAADFVGGGRPSYMGTPLSKRELSRYVALLADHGIHFNYLLNTACMGNREWSRRFHRKLTRLLDTLWKMGIRRLTISTPFLLEAIKARRPQFHLKVGIYAQIDTPLRAQFWEQLGADVLTLESFSINRDFARLRAIRQATRCRLQLIANHCCLPNCPMQPYHQNGFAHASDCSGRIFIDYCFFRCTRLRLEDPALFIKSAWIRPEDLGAYEAIGYDSFKLIERGMPSDELLKRVRAYSQRYFDGNLAELILPYAFPSAPVRQSRLRLLWHFLRPFQLNPLRLLPLQRIARAHGMLSDLKSNPIRIDARAIPPDFLDIFRSGNCCSHNCAACGHCQRIADQAVHIDETFRTTSLAQFRELEKALSSGQFWGQPPTASASW